MKITIQLLCELDIPEVLMIRNASYKNKLSIVSLSQWRHEAGSVILLARQKSVAVGYVHLSLKGRAVTVERLAVLPDFRRQSVGRALLETVKANFWPHDLIEMVLNDDDLTGCAFLEACGLELAAAEGEQLLFRQRVGRQPIRVKIPARREVSV